MDRRRFLKAGAAAATVLTAPRLLGSPRPSTSPGGPNLLIIHTDQQSCWTLGAYGGKGIETPHIDSLAREGALLSQFFTNSAVCTPSRGCLLTGRYPHAHGAYKNNLELNRDEVTLAAVLAGKGYDTGYAGKWHLDGKPKPGWMRVSRAMGFSDCSCMFNRGHWKKIEDREEGHPKVHPYQVMGDEATYTTDWLARKTAAFIDRPREHPFCFMVSIPDPHGPYRARPPYDALFKPEEMILPPTWKGENLPAWLEKEKRKGLKEERLRQNKAWYLGAVKLIDDCVGRILGTLKKRGILDGTIVVFTTDHGDYMGEHGLMGKNQLFETAYRIPMLIRWPGKIAGGTRVDRILSTVDFQPTLLGLMGIAPCGREQGLDASALLEGGKVEGGKNAGENVSHLHHSSHERAGIFTPEYQLAYVKESEAILYDRRNDPWQERNLFNDPKRKGAVAELTDRIIAHNVEVGAPAAKWLTELRS